MINLVRKVHIYAGLLVFSQFLIYGIAGIAATVQPSYERPKIPHTTRMVPFEVRPDETDLQVGNRVFDTLKPPMAHRIPQWALRRSPEGHLELNYYNINGIVRATVLEQQKQLRVESIRNSTVLFFEDIHAGTARGENQPALMAAWGWWNEVAMWTLIGFLVTGAWLWLGTRPRVIWTWAALVAGCAIFAGFWVVLR